MRCHHGITLIEVLVSVTILSIGLIGVANCFTAAVLSNKKASRIALATAVAQSTIENMRGSGNLEEIDEALNDPALPEGRVSVQVSDYQPQWALRQVTVEVVWRGYRSRTESVRLETIVSRRAKHTGG